MTSPPAEGPDATAPDADRPGAKDTRRTPASDVAESAGERGSATVETAIGITAVAFTLALCLAGIGAVIGQLRCADAAREAARLAARGDGSAAAVAADLAPSGAAVDISRSGDLITVTVRAPAVGLLPGLSVRASAVSAVEAEDG